MSSRMLKPRSNSVDPTSNGGLDEEQFVTSFVDVPKLNIYSQKDVVDKLLRIREVIGNANHDWDKRCLALKEIRSLLSQDHLKQLPDVQQQLRFLDAGLQISLKDLRSQVMREACITIAYLAQEFDGKFEPSSEALLQVLIPLIQNSAKVMATSAVTAIKFIIKAVHYHKLLLNIISNLGSKSNVIRKYCCEFIHIILTQWEKLELEKPSSSIQQAIKKGLGDADSEARYFSRKSFAAFSMLFPELGYSILISFDASKQKQLLCELDDPTLFDSLNLLKTPTKNKATAPDVIASATPKLKAKFGSTPKSVANPFKTPLAPKFTTPQRPIAVAAKVDSGIRSKYKVSQSTPTSRTASPSRSLRTPINPPPDVTPVSTRTPSHGTLRTPRSTVRNGTLTVTKKLVTQSQCNSREVSPTRRMTVKKRPSLTGSTGLCSEGLGNFSSMKSLPQSPCPENMMEYGRNLEAAISDAWRQKASWFRSSEDFDAYSETSSVCSETSSYRSHSDMTEDTLGIMSRLVCGLWSERKEGLTILQKFIRSGKRFNNREIRKVLDIIMRMFHDSHPKVLATFFEVLGDLVQAHHQDMLDLLPVLLSRLFSKAVSDVLGNLQEKITKTLDAIRVSFPCDRQMAAVCKYITEQPASINIKAKHTILLFLSGLTSGTESVSLNNSSDVRASVSKILTWTSEPKNAEVRKLSQSVIVNLARKCPEQFNSILALMPKTYQDGAKRIVAENNNSNGNNGTSRLGAAFSKIQVQKTSRIASPRDAAFSPTNSRVGGFHRTSVGCSEEGSESWDGIAKASEELQQLSLLEVEELNEGLLEDPAHLDTICNDGDSDADLGNLLESIKDSKDIAEWCNLMNSLISFIKASNCRELWNTHFKMTYALILEAIQDTESFQRKLLGLQALREMLERHAERFQPYAELTVMNLLDMEREKDRDVIRASDECRMVLSRAFPLDQSIGILNPICLTASYPVNMAAVKLLMKVFQFAPTEQVKEYVPAVAPGLVKGFEHEESGMRKSSMLCLVSIHQHIGDDLMHYIKDLSQNKMKLLNVYIRKSIGEGE